MTTKLDKLHNDIMNIPLPEEFTRVLNENNARAYKLGHRDARHAAAELVSAFAAKAEPFGYVLKTGHGNKFSETLDNVHPELRHMWVPVYKAN